MEGNGESLAGKVRNYIDDHWQRQCMAPTLREISEGTGIPSLSHIHYLITGLEKSGLLVPRISGRSRNVVPNWVVVAIREGRQE